ncbi:septum formation initiator family protein [Lachnospiraceae bacterium 29-84]
MDKREQARMSGARRTKLRRLRREHKTSMVGISVVLLVLSGVMSVQIVSLEQKNKEYRERRAQLEAEVESQEQRKEELEEYGKFVGTKEYIEQIAKTKLGLVYPNEIIFKEKDAKE